MNGVILRCFYALITSLQLQLPSKVTLELTNHNVITPVSRDYIEVENINAKTLE